MLRRHHESESPAAPPDMEESSGGRCEGTTKKGARCKAGAKYVVDGARYCTVHAHQAAAD